MEKERIYRVIISDRAKHALGVKVRFMAEISKSAAQKTKKNLIDAMRSLSTMPQRFPFLKKSSFRATSTERCLLKSGISSSIKSKTMPSM